jgi:hypothetical protein
MLGVTGRVCISIGGGQLMYSERALVTTLPIILCSYSTVPVKGVTYATTSSVPLVSVKAAQLTP